jgi:myosin heavy subunit
MMKLRAKIVEGKSGKEKPHIYLIAGNAFNSMVDQEKKQAIVISGESGAGKTESTKYCMQLLTSLSHQETHSIESKILACNPILEAFGNSKTTRNDNSSRFGKYVQIYFAKDNTIVGANINSYLLEKSRVVATAEK